MKTSDHAVKISDHAVLRFLERFKGIDVEETRRFLAGVMDTPRMNDVIEVAGQARCKVKKAEGIFCVQGGTLTTCYPSS